MHPLILASESPHRKKILEQLGLSFDSQAPRMDERELQKSYRGSVEDLSLFLAEAKAKSVSESHPEAYVLGSDQVLLFQGQALNKPETLYQTKDRLMTLQGQTHYLSTALYIASPTGDFKSCVVSTMAMHPMTEEEIDAWVQDEPALGCAGGYRIESKGPRLFSKIQTDDFYSIIGLPVLSLITFLKEQGFPGV